MLSVITLVSKKLMIMHYTTALNASKQENDTNYPFDIFYACAVIVRLQSFKTTLLAWHYFWPEEIGLDTFWTDLVHQLLNNICNLIALPQAGVNLAH